MKTQVFLIKILEIQISIGTRFKAWRVLSEKKLTSMNWYAAWRLPDFLWWLLGYFWWLASVDLSVFVVVITRWAMAGSHRQTMNLVMTVIADTLMQHMGLGWLIVGNRNIARWEEKVKGGSVEEGSGTGSVGITKDTSILVAVVATLKEWK